MLFRSLVNQLRMLGQFYKLRMKKHHWSRSQNFKYLFPDLKMLEHETINDFNFKLCDIANEAFALGEKYSDMKLVRKTLRSLPERFAYKVAAIEEARDVQNMRLDELMGSL